MKQFIFIVSLLLVASCNNKEEVPAEKESTSQIVEDYEKVDGRSFRAYYGSNNQLKTEGMYDEEGKKHGVWTQYFPDGKKQSVGEFKHGLKDGYSVVYHANGSIYYSGEYRDDQMVGIWDFYDTQTGKKSHAKDYGYPDKKK
jgi:antitoxin component YwqK of YwqJK toxin-antitoxin module